MIFHFNMATIAAVDSASYSLAVLNNAIRLLLLTWAFSSICMAQATPSLLANGVPIFQIEAELRFQAISFRWADNLKKYDAPEPKRFVRYYDSMASASSELVARGTTITR